MSVPNNLTEGLKSVHSVTALDNSAYTPALLKLLALTFLSSLSE